VTRLEVPARPGLYLLEVRRRGRGPLLVVWEQRDSFGGEDEPPVPFDWPWPAQRVAVVDALGQAQPAEVVDGRVRLQVSLTPLFVTAAWGGRSSPRDPYRDGGKTVGSAADGHPDPVRSRRSTVRRMR
jgi:hypothetical protein